jgi:NhaC family Na+:H+ antiporter
MGTFLQEGAPESTTMLIAAGNHVQTYWLAAATGFELYSNNATLNELLSRGGMVSMLTTVWLIISAMFFSGMMERTGILQRLLVALLTFFKKDGHLVSGAGLTALATNVVASDQYMSIVLTSRMYSEEFRRKGLDPKNLSRVVEDNGTVTSALVPWNTCGAFMAGTLGVATFAYLPFCIFNLMSPIISHIYAAVGFKISKSSGELTATSRA